MAAQIKIPEAAVDAAGAAGRVYDGVTWKVIREVLDAAAPLIVAAELRRLAAELSVQVNAAYQSNSDPEWLLYAVRVARRRADALDPEGRAR